MLEIFAVFNILSTSGTDGPSGGAVWLKIVTKNNPHQTITMTESAMKVLHFKFKIAQEIENPAVGL